MRCSLFFLLIVVLTLLSVGDAGRRKKKTKEPNCPKIIKHYQKCLKKGHVSNLGCEYADHKALKGKAKAKCEKHEAAAKDCGYSCAPAPVDGGLGDFGEWSECSKPCGGGMRTKTRLCNNPEPANGGAECEVEMVGLMCNIHPCPVDGGLGEWGEWTQCTAECGGGTMTRERLCNNPEPSDGGKDCEGEMEGKGCNNYPCSVDGGFGEWGTWSECTVPCGGGMSTRFRKCDNPAPENGGAICEGLSDEYLPCNIEPCPVNGGWGEFGDWSECSAECGGGSQSRSRACDSPSPANGGAGCVGDETETMDCNTDLCAPDKLWRADGRCGAKFPLSDGTAAQCNPDHPDGHTCCSPYGWCGSSPAHCTCASCVNYNPVGIVGFVTASQNSKGWNGDPARAIDGNTDGRYGGNSCTHTSGTSNNWWMATLSGNTKISKVVISNRVDCCQDRINGAQVWVRDTMCGTVTYEAGKDTYEIDCGGAVGRSVRIVQNDNYLTLCEVQVIGSPAKDASDAECWDKGDRDLKGLGYNGSKSTTRSGKTCQNWSEQTPHRHGFTEANGYWEKGLGDHNYCRNPSSKYTETWCYTTSSTRWDWCDVPTC